MAASRPNVLFVFTDQQRWDSCGAHGHPAGLTPNYDRLARTGTHLARCYTPQPVCGPARACLQTGTFATTNGCFRNGIALPQNLPTMAQSFREAGYATGYIGKWHLANHQIVPPEERGGYDYWLAANALEMSSDAYDCRVWDGDGQQVKLPGYRVDALTDAAIRYMTAPREQPFFLFLSFLEPHHQNHHDSYPAPTGYREAYQDAWIPPDLRELGGSTHRDLAGYYGMIKRLDEALGRMLDALKSLGMEEETIVVFTSDHGCHFKTRNGEYKRSGHESAARVPGVISGPGFVAGGERPELVSLLDLPPTLLDACRLTIPETMEGRSLLPRLRGEGDWRDALFIQTSEAETGRILASKRWKYGVVDPEPGMGGQRAAAPRYVESYLYDLEQDLYELDNLIGIPSYQEVTAALRSQLQAMIQEVENATPAIETVHRDARTAYQRKPDPQPELDNGAYQPHPRHRNG